MFLAYPGNPFGSEQGGLRPVVIMQNDWGCVYSPTVTMVPLTSNLKKVHLASHYVLQDAFFLKRISMVLGEQIDTIDKHRLHTFLGRLSENEASLIRLMGSVLMEQNSISQTRKAIFSKESYQRLPKSDVRSHLHLIAEEQAALLAA